MRNCPALRRRRLCGLLLESLEPRELLSGADPTAMEQFDLELINRFRQNPVQELPLLLASGNANITSALTTYGVDLNALYTAFSTLTPVAPLAWNAQMYTATLAHDQLMSADDTQSHQLPGELVLGDRITSTGYVWNFVGENIFAYAEDVLYGHAGFVIDWGTGTGGVQNPPGHRNNLLDSSFRDASVAVINGVTGQSTGPLLMTEDFGNQASYGNPILTGVVYNDANNNGYYDPGEGMGGVSVHIVGGAVNTTISTLTAGMYQAALPAGSYTVTYTGSFGVRSQNVTMGSANQALDLNTATTAATSTTVGVAANTASGITLTATVAAASGTPAGSVTFYNGNTVVGTAALVNGTATYQSATLPRSTDLLIAVYGGSASYQQSVSAIDQAILNDTTPPVVAAVQIRDYTSFASPYTFTLTFADNASVNVNTLKDPSAVVVTGPGGFSAYATFVSVDNNSNGATRVATYTVTGPGGSWNSVDEGTYAVSIVAGKIQDVSGNAMGFQRVGAFNVAPAPFFDESWYLATYPDVAAAVANGEFRSGFDHFQTYGQREGRNPSAYFSQSYYLAQNPDVAAAVRAGAFASGFAHFIAYGQQEGRAANMFFDEKIYLALNPDVAAAVGAGEFASGFEHYLLYGAAEKRRASAYFDATYYLSANPDVNAAVNAGAFVSGFQHFMEYGFAEHRPAQALFNQTYYLAHNPDVAAAVASGALVSAYAHFVMYGQFEHRNPSTSYDDAYYLAHNPDVAAAVAAGAFESGFEHYTLYGQFEGRVAHA